jgi:hypothetical protein
VTGAFTVGFIVIYQYNCLAFFMCFCWGFQDSSVNAHIQGLLGFEFDEIELAYSVLNSMMSFTVIPFLIIESYIAT